MANDPQKYYQLLAQLLRDVPTFEDGRDLTADEHAWLGRTSALVRKVTSNVADWVQIDQLIKTIKRAPRAPDLQQILGVMYKALAVIELELEPQAQGAFIPAGNAFDAISALSRVIGSAGKSIFIVDPYMDESVFSKAAILASEGIPIRLLTDEA